MLVGRVDEAVADEDVDTFPALCASRNLIFGIAGGLLEASIAASRTGDGG